MIMLGLPIELTPKHTGADVTRFMMALEAGSFEFR